MNAPDKQVGHMALWESLRRPPKEALKTIKAGRLSGMTDVSPQWRYQAVTGVFGPIGIGWTYEITGRWTEHGSDGQVCAFVQVALRVKQNDQWSAPIPGVGGSMLIAKEKSGLHTSDEAFKMALTDALSVAFKQLGVAADIYMGLWDGSKYKDAPTNKHAPVRAAVSDIQFNEEDREWLKIIAAQLVDMVEAQGKVAEAYNFKEAQKLDNDQTLVLWDLLAPNSKTRSELKKEGQNRRLGEQHV